MDLKRLGAIAGISMVFASGFAGYKVRAAVHPSVNETLDAARLQAQQGKEKEAGSYAEAMLMGSALKVSVDYGDTPESQLVSCDEAVAGAFEMWETSLDGTVKFNRVGDPKQADIKIHFGSDVKLNGQIVSGYVNWTRNISRTAEGVKPVFDADIHVRTTDPKGKLMKANAMRHTCGHEMGHVFGLDDVPQVGMLMGPLDLRKPVSKPTEAEIETVKAIREEASAILQSSRGQHAQYFDHECSGHHDH